MQINSNSDIYKIQSMKRWKFSVNLSYSHQKARKLKKIWSWKHTKRYVEKIALLILLKSHQNKRWNHKVMEAELKYVLQPTYYADIINQAKSRWF